MNALYTLFDHLVGTAGRMSGERAFHRMETEIARYPAIIRADIGWPPALDERLERIIVSDDSDKSNSFD